MPYYLRLFSTDSLSISTDVIAEDLPDGCHLDVEWEDEHGWRQLVVKTAGNDPICLLERTEKDLVVAEIQEFRERLLGIRPTSGTDWARAFLAKCGEIYACQVLYLGFGEKWGAVPATLLWALKDHLSDGICMLMARFFSIEDGYHITWEFASNVGGPWAMALRSDDGWTCFDMDLGDLQQREEFCDGKVPKNASLR